MKLTRTSQHDYHDLNARKGQGVLGFITEYRRVSNLILDDIWFCGYEWEYSGVCHHFLPSKGYLDTPKYIDYKRFDVETTLTARALSSLVTQLSGIIDAEVSKQRKRLFILNKRKEEGVSKTSLKPLTKAIKSNNPSKPSCSRINPELSSKCADWLETDGEFDGFLRLKSITKDRVGIRIPVKFHKQSRRLQSKPGSEMLKSFSIGSGSVSIRWRFDKPDVKDVGSTVGADQGLKDVLTLSDSQTTPKTCLHGHTLECIAKKLSRKRKGSKGFKRTQQHRKNFVNYSINQLNLAGIQQINLEKISNIGFGRTQSRMMSHWTNTTIRDKVEKVCEENGVRLTHQSSTYRSQRCSCCGLVRKANRKGKLYSCKECGLEIDADLNAAKNHEAQLPDIPDSLRKLKINRGGGFLWKPTGFYDSETGRSLESLPPVEEL